MTNDPFQLIVISVSEGACTAPISFKQSQQPKHNLVDHYEVIGRANLIDPIKFVGHNGRISLISLKLIGINGLVVKCNGLFEFIGIFGIDRLVGIVDLSCLDDLIGLVDLVEIPTPEWPPAALGQPSASMAEMSTPEWPPAALGQPSASIAEKSTPEWQSTSPTSGQLSLVSFAGFIGHFSLVGRCIIGLIESAASLNYWPLGLIGIISLGLIASSASTASLACRLISFVSLVGSSTHRLFRKHLTAPVIEATNIDLNGLNGLNGIIGLVGFGLNCLDNFNGIIGLVGFGLIGCNGFIVGITTGLNVLVKLVSLVGFFDCIGEPAFDLNFNYRSSVVGKLNYLAQTARADIMYATHQTAKYSSDPRTSHGEAVLYLIHYLKKTRDLGLLFKPDPNKDFECYCDADFSGLCNRAFTPVDPSTSKSRNGWIIFYAGCPISWASKLLSQVALYTTKAEEYIAMSQALRDVIPNMGLLQEMREQDFKVLCTEPYVYYNRCCTGEFHN
jgi:hypothetical protein